MLKLSSYATKSALALSLIVGANIGVANIGVANVSANEVQNNNVQENAEISQEDIIQIKSFLNQYDVDQETQTILLEKLNAGDIWDSLKKGEEPIRSFEIQTNDIVEKVEEYKDGSIVVSSIDYESVEEFENIKPLKGNLISTLGVDPGTKTSGSGYANYKKAKVYYNTGIANAYFYADFTLVNGGYDYIDRVYDHKVTAFGGSASEISLTLTKAKENANGKASAKLDFNYINFNTTASTTCWLKLTVGGDSYKETHSF